VVGDKNILDIIDAQTRQRMRTYLGKPAKLGRARIFGEKSLGG
jgi:hypothetical protein